MGCLYEWNWILKLEETQIPELKIGKQFNFFKKGMRVYPIDIPIDLVNENWEAIARCVVSSITIEKEVTKGIYQIISIYDEVERNVLTKLWRDTVCHVTKDYKIDDFSKKHIT